MLFFLFPESTASQITPVLSQFATMHLSLFTSCSTHLCPGCGFWCSAHEDVNPLPLVTIRLFLFSLTLSSRRPPCGNLRSQGLGLNLAPRLLASSFVQFRLK